MITTIYRTRKHIKIEGAEKISDIVEELNRHFPKKGLG